MLDFMGVNRWIAALAALLGASSLASPLAAQQVLVETEEGRFVCSTLPDGGLCSSDLACADGTVCRRFDGSGTTGGRCVAPGTVFCCAESFGCPLATAAMPEALTCQPVSGLSGASGLCLPDVEYCGATHLEGIVACHTRPDGTRTLAWAEGDCDRDGLTNGAETSLGTSPCAAPAPMAVFDGEQCARLGSGCTVGATCANNGGPGFCLISPDGNGSVCMPPSSGSLPCCESGVAECPSDLECVATRAGDLCISGLCLDREGVQPIDCVTNAEGAVVSFAEGDCDRDGVSNKRELDDGSNPCGDDDAEDAGVAGPDGGGSSGDDAGGTFDAGTEPPPGLQVRFEGGGGCSCRAAPSGSAPMGALFATLMVLLALRRPR